jgi:hypothetical protein
VDNKYGLAAMQRMFSDMVDVTQPMPGVGIPSTFEVPDHVVQGLPNKAAWPRARLDFFRQAMLVGGPAVQGAGRGRGGSR